MPRTLMTKDRPRRGTPADAAATAGVRFSRARLATGVELHVAEAGPADGQPVLFLHGYTDSWFSFSRVFERLPAWIRAIAPTQRGHGDSERPASDYRQADFAGDAIALMDALRIDRADIVGHSMGSFVAQRIAIEHPDRVHRLVVVGGGDTAHARGPLELYAAVQHLVDPVDREFVREFQASSVAAPVPAAFMDQIVRESLKLPAAVWREALGRLVAREEQLDPRRIESPTLIVWGDLDSLMSQHEQDRLVAAVRGARLLRYCGIGHSPPWEVPALFVDDLTTFIRAQ